MKILLTTTLFFSVSFFFFGQHKIDYIPLSSISPDSNDDDLKQLDTFFQNKKIIGIGESTHGTSEFTTMRHRLFKYLVEHHQFNTFFLEADYNACKRVNRYIHGVEDNVDSALCEVLLWPWLTKEMTILIDWMREYNLSNDNKLNFVGCDMQLFQDERNELKLFFQEDEEVLTKMDKMLTFVNDGKSLDSVGIKNAFSEWNRILDLTKNEESSDWKLMRQGIKQWFEACFQGNYNLRDSCMAENILYYSSLYTDVKGIYFAHNWHVGKFRLDYDKYPSMMTTGYYLDQRLGDKYYTVGQLTYRGKFNVVFYNRKDAKLIPIDIVFNTKDGIEQQLYQTRQPFLFTSTERFFNESYSIGSIGAVAGKQKGKPRVPDFLLLNNINVFDSFLYIEQTTPTKLIKQY